jgi:3-phenylpropionate/trans-cinnamate dioxygenase ferredoxin subunit
VAEYEVMEADLFPPGSMQLVAAGDITVGVYNCNGELRAIEDRCSHDDGPLCEGDWETDTCRVICPRHGSAFDLLTGVPLSLPAYEPVATFSVRVREDGMVVVDVG